MDLIICGTITLKECTPLSQTTLNIGLLRWFNLALFS